MRSRSLNGSDVIALRGSTLGCTASGWFDGLQYSGNASLLVNSNAYALDTESTLNILIGNNGQVIGNTYTFNVIVPGVLQPREVFLDVNGNCQLTSPCLKGFFRKSGGWGYTFTYPAGRKISPDEIISIGYDSLTGSRIYRFPLSSFGMIERFSISSSNSGSCLCGSISPVGTQIYSQGSNATYSINPDSGFAIESVTVDGVVVGVGNIYTFTNISASHTIQVRFKPQTP